MEDMEKYRSFLLKRISQMSPCELKIVHELFNETTPVPEFTIRDLVKNTLVEYGIDPQTKGFKYMTNMLIVMVEEPESYENGLTFIRQNVAEIYDTNVCKLNQAISVALNNAIVRTPERFDDFSIPKNKITPTRFLYAIAERLQTSK